MHRRRALDAHIDVRAGLEQELGAGEVALPAEAQAQTRASRALEAGDFEELEEAFEEEEAALQANIKEKRQRSFGTFSALDRR